MNTVFQSYALFPHMTVAQNIAFGLEMLKKRKPEIDSTVEQMLAQLRAGQDGRSGRRPEYALFGELRLTLWARVTATD